MAHRLLPFLFLALAACDPYDGIGDPCTPESKEHPDLGEVEVESKSMQCRSRLCLARSHDEPAYCSCRCANVDGRTDDGARYCTCPDAFQCKQVVSSIGVADEQLTGAYCVR